MLKSIIIDDELAARKSLEKIIQLYLPSQVTVDGLADNLKAGIQLIHKTKPDIVFLDIEMPLQSGLELFDYVDVDFDVVVISAYKDYAIEALRNGATDYLLKPVNVNELKQAIDRITESRSTDTKNTSTPLPIEIGKLLLPCPNGFLVITYAEIMAIEAEGNQSTIYKSTGEKIIVNKGIGSFEDLLPKAHFFRIHRSSIINIKYVTEINRDRNFVVLNNKIKLVITAINIKPLLDKLKEILDAEYN